MTLSFSDPEETGGARLYPKDILGHLLLVWAIEYIPHSPTAFTQPGKPSDVIVVDVVDLDLADEHGKPGLCARRTWWRQAQLIMGLKARIGGQPVLARMDKGVASMGRAAPFQLTSMKSDQYSVQRAQAWSAANPGWTPSSPAPAWDAPPPVTDPWATTPAPQQHHQQPQQQLPPPRPATPQEMTVLERLARSSVTPQGPQDQGPIPF